MRRAVFLDRDGVLSVPEFRDGRSFAVKRLEDFVLYDDAVDSVRTLKAAGFLVIVATNQPDVGAGLVPRDVVEAMHERLKAWTTVDGVEVSYETRAQGGQRRKPLPGMLLDAARNWTIDLGSSYMVGDRASDIECGHAAGCHAVFVDRGYAAEPQPSGVLASVASLSEAVNIILDHAGIKPAQGL